MNDHFQFTTNIKPLFKQFPNTIQRISLCPFIYVYFHSVVQLPDLPVKRVENIKEIPFYWKKTSSKNMPKYRRKLKIFR